MFKVAVVLFAAFVISIGYKAFEVTGYARENLYDHKVIMQCNEKFVLVSLKDGCPKEGGYGKAK